MNKKSKINLSRLLLFVFWILFIVGIALVSNYYITEKTNSCTSDPFGYGVEKLKNTLEGDIDYVFGTVNVFLSDGRILSEKFGDINNSLE